MFFSETPLANNTRATVEITRPYRMITLDPNLSTILPFSGEPMAVSTTSGTSMKLASEGVTPNNLTARDGRKRIEDWNNPYPKEITPTSRICRYLKKFTLITGRGAVFSIKNRIATRMVAKTNNGSTDGERRLSAKFE